jgi:hypothetical protein
MLQDAWCMTNLEQTRSWCYLFRSSIALLQERNSAAVALLTDANKVRSCLPESNLHRRSLGVAHSAIEVEQDSDRLCFSVAVAHGDSVAVN